MVTAALVIAEGLGRGFDAGFFAYSGAVVFDLLWATAWGSIS